MKKIVGLLILACLAFCAIPAQAQFKFGVKGGVNLSTVKFSSDVLDANNITGFQIGPILETTLPVLGIGFDVAVLYSKKGMDLQNEDISTDYVEVPLNLKWKFDLPIVKPFLTAGPYVGFRVGGDKIWKVVDTQIEAKSFAAGLNFGAGVEVFSHLQVGVNYGLGLTDNYSTMPVNMSTITDSDGKSSVWSITAAIFF